MKVTVVVTVVLLIATIAQWNIPISEGKTLLTYVIPFALLITRFMHVLAMLNVPIPDKFGFISELVICSLGLFMFFMAAGKNDYPIYWIGIASDILISCTVVGVMLFERNYYVITTISETVVVKYDKEDK